MSKRFADDELAKELLITSWGAECSEEVQRVRVLRRFVDYPHHDDELQ